MTVADVLSAGLYGASGNTCSLGAGFAALQPYHRRARLSRKRDAPAADGRRSTQVGREVGLVGDVECDVGVVSRLQAHRSDWIVGFAPAPGGVANLRAGGVDIPDPRVPTKVAGRIRGVAEQHLRVEMPSGSAVRPGAHPKVADGAAHRGGVAGLRRMNTCFGPRAVSGLSGGLAGTAGCRADQHQADHYRVYAPKAHHSRKTRNAPIRLGSPPGVVVKG
jgi:hypothetical protein